MRIVIAATIGRSLINFRGELIKEWTRRGHEVICISIEPVEEMERQINSLGAKYYQVQGNRTGTNIITDFKMLCLYNKAFKSLKPDLCFLYMSKPVAYGGLAAIHCGIKRIIVFVTGLEIAFYSKGIKNVIVRLILKTLFKRVHKSCEHVFFQNHDDFNKMLKWKLVTKEQSTIVNGSGVDMTYFTKRPMPDNDVVLMTARLVWSKGIREYIEAAKIVKEKYPELKFILVGGLDENPESLSKEELDDLVKKGIIDYRGFAQDVRPHLEECSVFVLPSYHEGNGRSIVEAEAVGRPIVTTIAPGCRETVVDGYNGFLVPVKDSKALAEKIILIIENKELKYRMAENSYVYCCEKYDVRKVNSVFLEKMRISKEDNNGFI